MRFGRAASIALLALTAPCVLAGCRHKSKRHVAPSASASSVVSRPKLAPLAAESWLVDLEVKGFGAAKVAVPLGATQPRAIVIALHGSADRPEWACGAWRGIAGPAPFVLCPRGTLRADLSATDARYTFDGPDAVALELRAGLTALKQKFGVHVAPGSVVFVGLGIGADRVASLAAQEPTFFARLALVDPAPETWPTPESAFFGREGGERVLFVGEPLDRTAAEFKALLTRRGGADAKAVFLEEPGSGLGPASVKQLAAAWPWLVATGPHHPAPENLAGNPIAAKKPELPLFR